MSKFIFIIVLISVVWTAFIFFWAGAWWQSNRKISKPIAKKQTEIKRFTTENHEYYVSDDDFSTIIHSETCKCKKYEK